MARILIVESQSFFARALANDLAALGHSFIWAESSAIAREKLELEDFDLVIADGKHAGYAGVDLARWIDKNKPTPVILMADFADQADPQQPYGLKKVTLLIKPFALEGVRSAVLSALPQDLDGRENYKSMVGLPRITLKKAGVAEFNLYHYVAGRPALLVNRGEAYILDQLKVPPETRFYTDQQSLTGILANSLRLSQAARQNTAMTPEKRARLLQTTLQIANEQMAFMGVGPEVVADTAETLATYLHAVEEGAVWETLSDLDSYSRPVYAQTLASTLISLMIAREQMYSAQDTFMLATAAMFHDVGLTTLDPVLLKTARALLSMKDRQTVDRHVEIGAAILQKTGWVTQEVCNIVLQHHENDSGNGFPRGLKAQQIHPMARVLRVADEFALSIMSCAGHRGIPAERAIALMKNNNALDQKAVASLEQILKLSKAPQKVLK